jgi:hypothetical protein
MAKEKSKLVKGLFAAGAGVILLGAGAYAGSQMFPVEITKTFTVEKIVPVEVIKEVQVEVIKEVPVEKIVEVTDTKLDSVLQHIYDNEGNVQYLTEDLDDDEVALIADRIVFINDIKKLSVDAVKNELFDELDGELVGLVELDDRDMEKLKVADEHEDLIIEEVDFEDKDAEVIVTGTFKQDDVKYDFEVVVIFKDGEYDEMDITSVTPSE